MTREFGHWGTYFGGARSIRDHLTALLGEVVDHYDLDALEEDLVACVDAALPPGYAYAGGPFIGPDSGDWAPVRAAVQGVDIWEIVARHDLHAADDPS